MGREIRRVPLDWQHPRDHRGEYIPLHDESYETARDRWIAELNSWYHGTHPDRLESRQDWDYWEWAGDPPERESHRPAWPDGVEMGYQIYETVSAGTPVSPVFATTDEMVAWLIGRGHSEVAARRFVEMGSVPSLMAFPDGGGGYRVLTGVDIAGANPEKPC